MKAIESMLRDGASRQDVLTTMPKRPKEDQHRVWAEGLLRIQQALARATNRDRDALVERVSKGVITGLFFDPLEDAETYVKLELRRSRSREEGERKRQQWLMDVLVLIGEARVSGAQTLSAYKPAADKLAEGAELVDDAA